METSMTYSMRHGDQPRDPRDQPARALLRAYFFWVFLSGVYNCKNANTAKILGYRQQEYPQPKTTDPVPRAGRVSDNIGQMQRNVQNTSSGNTGNTETQTQSDERKKRTWKKKRTVPGGRTGLLTQYVRRKSRNSRRHAAHHSRTRNGAVQ